MSDPDEIPKKDKPKKAPPANLVIPAKKPALTKAERRALQEKQRAEKEQRQTGGGGGSNSNSNNKKGEDSTATTTVTSAVATTTTTTTTSTTTTKTPSKPLKTSSSSEEVSKVGKIPNDNDSKDDKAIDLFSHLPQYQGTFFYVILLVDMFGRSEHGPRGTSTIDHSPFSFVA